MAHAHAPEEMGRRYATSVGLNLVFVVAEAGFGLASGSLALLSDAGHNLSDILGLLLAWAASRLVRRRPTARHTYGWRASSILAALLNAGIILVAVGGIAVEAVQRLGENDAVPSTTIIWVALAGTVVNGLSASLFLRGREHDLNVRGAFLHMASDAGVSLGVAVAGLILFLTGWAWIDPVVSLIVVAVVAVNTIRLLRDAVHLAIGGVPENIDLSEVREYLENLPGVEAVHDLHVWGLGTTDTALTAHLLKPDPTGDDPVLARADRELEELFGIAHMTIQFERGEEEQICDLSCELDEEPEVNPAAGPR